MKLENLSLKQLAVFVSDHLRRNGVDNVLTGGACVSIYTNSRYRSYDLDFVNVADAGASQIRAALAKIGFIKEGRIYLHPAVKYSLDILSPPLSIGEEKVGRVHTITLGTRVPKLLSPTDSVKDRLAAFYFWNDRQSLAQALLVCRQNKVDFTDIKRWSAREKELDKYEIFLSGLKKAST